MKGFTKEKLEFQQINLNWNNYKKDGYINGDANGAPDDDIYFYRGIGESDCIEFIMNLGLV